jgi:orotate phosphoribosyltransferase
MVQRLHQVSEGHVKKILDGDGIIQRDVHVVLHSGQHSSAMVDMDALFTKSSLAATISFHMTKLIDFEKEIQAVIGPAMNGWALAREVAQELCIDGLRVCFADKIGLEFFLRPCFEKYINGKGVLVVDDVITTGNSLKVVTDIVRLFQGEVVGVAALWNRGNVPAELFGVPEEKFRVLVTENLPMWSKEQCPLCTAGKPINMDLSSVHPVGVSVGA